MEYLITCVLTVFAVEIFFRLPIHKSFMAINRTAMDALLVMRSKELSDDQKQARLMRASLQLFGSTIKTAFMLACLVGAVVGLYYLLAFIGIAGENLLSELTANWTLMGVSCFIGVGYAFIRPKLSRRHCKSTTEYNGFSKTLHRIALGRAFIARTSYELESSLMGDKISPDQAGHGQHVFIAGLARAGTTILMRTFFQSGDFRSLTYRDMPFVLMPNLWLKLSRTFRSHKEEVERAHGDRILVNFDSPEAFEEVFWRVYCGKDYIQDDKLTAHDPNLEIRDEFKRYVALILASADDNQQQKYLSKNNNNILRLNAIHSIFPNATIIIPFRDPLQQAASLLNQQTRFVRQQSGDPFILDYMNWLGHYEFGINHKPFCFDANGLGGPKWRPDNINYWLQTWMQCYAYLLEHAPAKSIFLSYEYLCGSPEEALGLFVSRNDLDAAAAAKTSLKIAESRTPAGVDEKLLKDASALYEQLTGLNSPAAK